MSRLDLFVLMSFWKSDSRGDGVEVAALGMKGLGGEISGLGEYGVDRPFLWMLPASTACQLCTRFVPLIYHLNILVEQKHGVFVPIPFYPFCI